MNVSRSDAGFLSRQVLVRRHNTDEEEGWSYFCSKVYTVDELYKLLGRGGFQGQFLDPPAYLFEGRLIESTAPFRIVDCISGKLVSAKGALSVLGRVYGFSVGHQSPWSLFRRSRGSRKRRSRPVYIQETRMILSVEKSEGEPPYRAHRKTVLRDLWDKTRDYSDCGWKHNRKTQYRA